MTITARFAALPPFLGFILAHTKAKQVFHLAFGISQRKSRSAIDAEPKTKPAQKHSSSPVNRTKVALMAESKKYIYNALKLVEFVVDRLGNTLQGKQYSD